MDHDPELELTHWDLELTVSAVEIAEQQNQAKEVEERNLVIDRPQVQPGEVAQGAQIDPKRGAEDCLVQGNTIHLTMFGLLALATSSAEKEKHAYAVVHEILSLTFEKCTLVDHRTG
jgi:hypothetical protein